MNFSGLWVSTAVSALLGADGKAPTIPAVVKPVDLKALRVPVEEVPAPEKLAIDYNFGDSPFPKASVLSVTKPAQVKDSTAGKASVSDGKADAQDGSKAVEPTPPPATDAKAPVHQVGVAKPPVGAELLAAHRALATAVQMLGASPIETDRMQALATIAKTPGWQQYRPTYLALRRVALTEYNIKMRATAVELLGQARSDHGLVADTLRLSAQYDSDAGVRAKAYATIERLAAAPPDYFAR
jgi:hypothetical protein